MTDHANGPWPDIAIPPGEFLADHLEAMGLSQADLARRVKLPEPTIRGIIEDGKAIDPDMADRLESALGMPADVWLNLENGYRANKARLEAL